MPSPPSTSPPSRLQSHTRSCRLGPLLQLLLPLPWPWDRTQEASIHKSPLRKQTYLHAQHPRKARPHSLHYHHYPILSLPPRSSRPHLHCGTLSARASYSGSRRRQRLYGSAGRFSSLAMARMWLLEPRAAGRAASSAPLCQPTPTGTPPTPARRSPCIPAAALCVPCLLHSASSFPPRAHPVSSSPLTPTRPWHPPPPPPAPAAPRRSGP